MHKQVQQLLKEKDLQGALEMLKPRDENAGLVLADYLNEKKMWAQTYISDEEWQTYNGEVLERVKQLCQDDEDRLAREAKDDVKTTEPVAAKRTMPKAFISYSNKDRDIVKKLTDYLQEKHYDFFVDTISMVPGEVIATTITREIIERDYFVVLLSKNSMRSPWVCLESVISNAKEITGHGRVVPVRLDDCLDDFKFLLDVQENIRDGIAEMDKHIVRSKKYFPDHKFLDTERQRQVEFQSNYSNMIDRYRNMVNINISGDLFDVGIKELIAAIQKTR
jgi:hypothetical protein